MAQSNRSLELRSRFFLKPRRESLSQNLFTSVRISTPVLGPSLHFRHEIDAKPRVLSCMIDTQLVNLPTTRSLKLKAGNYAITCECPLLLASVRAALSSPSSSSIRSLESFVTNPSLHISLQCDLTCIRKVIQKSQSGPEVRTTRTTYTVIIGEKAHWIPVTMFRTLVAQERFDRYELSHLTRRTDAFQTSDGSRSDRVNMPFRINTRRIPEKLTHNCIPLHISRVDRRAAQLFQGGLPRNLGKPVLPSLCAPVKPTQSDSPCSK